VIRPPASAIQRDSLEAQLVVAGRLLACRRLINTAPPPRVTRTSATPAPIAASPQSKPLDELVEIAGVVDAGAAVWAGSFALGGFRSNLALAAGAEIAANAASTVTTATALLIA
jgi:hypothetical protein